MGMIYHVNIGCNLFKISFILDIYIYILRIKHLDKVINNIL